MVFIPSSSPEFSQSIDSSHVISALNCHRNALAGILALHKSRQQEQSNKAAQFVSGSNSSSSRNRIQTGPTSVILATLYKYHIRQARLLEEMLHLLNCASTAVLDSATTARDAPDDLDTVGELPTFSARQQLVFGPDTLLSQPARVDAVHASDAHARRQSPLTELERLRRQNEELQTLKESHIAQVCCAALCCCCFRCIFHCCFARAHSHTFCVLRAQIEQLISERDSARHSLDAAECEMKQLRALNAELAARLVSARCNSASAPAFASASASLPSSPAATAASAVAVADTPQALYESTSADAPGASLNVQFELYRLENEYLRAAIRGPHLPAADAPSPRTQSAESNKV